MFYVGLGDVRLNIERVAMRVKNGGHHIETEDIQLLVVDNSKADGEIILGADISGIKYYSNELPEWVQIIDRELKLKYQK